MNWIPGPCLAGRLRQSFIELAMTKRRKLIPTAVTKTLSVHRDTKCQFARNYNFLAFKCREFETTLTELKAIAKPAKTGESCQPVQ